MTDEDLLTSSREFILIKKFTKEQYLTCCSTLGYSVTEGFVKHLEKKKSLATRRESITPFSMCDGHVIYLKGESPE